MSAARLLRLFSVILAAACAGPTLAADYAALAERAKASFEPITAEQVEDARNRLATQAIAVEGRFDPATDFGAGWLDYLKWSGVQKQMSAGAEPDLDAARRTLAALGSGAEGLESPLFERTADALRRYIGVARLSGARDQTRTFNRVVDRLVKLLEAGDLDDPRRSYEVERRLALLEGAGVGGELVAAVRSEFGASNAHLEVTSGLLSRITNQTVSDCEPVSDTILGTRISGTGQTTGQLSVDTLPAIGHARLEFTLTGTTTSQTRGVNGPVAIYSSGQTDFTARKTVELTDGKFRLMPSTASAQTYSHTNSVKKIGGGLLSGFVERVAKGRVAEQKPRADAIASDRAEARVAQQLDDRLLERMREARREYDDRLSKPLRRRRATPRSINQQSTSDLLLMDVVQAGEGQLAAPGAPPAVSGGDLTARIHQSAVNNLLASYFGGATLRRDSQDEEARLVDRVTPDWLTQDADEPTPAPREDVDFKPYRIRFRAGRPISCAFEGGEVRVIAHIATMRVNGDRYEDWDLILTFRPEVADGRWKLVRQGDVEVLPTGFDPESGEKLPTRLVALRGNLSKALNDPADRLPREFRIDPIDLDEEASIDLLAMTELRLEDGWVVASWVAE